MQPSGAILRTHQKFTRTERKEHIDKIKKYESYIIDEETGKEECVMPFEGLKYVMNCVIDDDPSSVNIELMMSMFQRISATLDLNKGDLPKKAVLCAMCAHKIGVKRCSACPKESEIRYCSRVCQVAAWPLHKKAECAGCRVEDVE
jgi:hypothetical protein